VTHWLSFQAPKIVPGPADRVVIAPLHDADRVSGSLKDSRLHHDADVGLIGPMRGVADVVEARHEYLAVSAAPHLGGVRQRSTRYFRASFLNCVIAKPVYSARATGREPTSTDPAIVRLPHHSSNLSLTAGESANLANYSMALRSPAMPLCQWS
jgi:hypothetical protein